MTHSPSLPAWHHWHRFKPVLGWICCLLLVFVLRAKVGPEMHRTLPLHPAAAQAAAPGQGDGSLPVVHLVDPATAPRDGITPAIGN